MTKYFVITGVTNAGKTSTIRELWRLMGGAVLPTQPHDFHKILCYNLQGKQYKVGFHSWGDSFSYLNCHEGGVPDLEQNGCDAIISAAKSHGATHSYFTNRCQVSDLFFVAKAWYQNAGFTNLSLVHTANYTKLLIDTFI